MMKIIQAPDPILLQEAKSVDRVTPELQQLAKDMYKLMTESNGVGLAAPQVGQPIRLIVIDNDGPLYMFNPLILERSSNRVIIEEGCLSFENGTLFRKIKRPENITVKYRDINNKMKFLKCSGLLSRIILHECDHLFGTLFTSYDEET